MKKKKVLFQVPPRQCTVPRVDRSNGKIARIELWIASPCTVFSGSGSQRLLPVYRLKNIAPGKEIWLQWRSNCQKWSVFEVKDKLFYKKGIEMLEKCWSECITREGDYVDKWSRILPKNCCFISHPTNLLSNVLSFTISQNYKLYVHYLSNRIND